MVYVLDASMTLCLVMIVCASMQAALLLDSAVAELYSNMCSALVRMMLALKKSGETATTAKANRHLHDACTMHAASQYQCKAGTTASACVRLPTLLLLLRRAVKPALMASPN